jgi:hypothetical protein
MRIGDNQAGREIRKFFGGNPLQKKAGRSLPSLLKIGQN